MSRTAFAARPAKPTATQLQILRNARDGRALDQGRALTQSAAAGWDCSLRSCVRRGWLDRNWTLTDAGRTVLAAQ